MGVLNYMKTFSSFGEAVRYCRVKRELTLDQLAARSEVGASFISKIERCENDNVTRATRARIAAGLDIPVWALEYLASGECKIRRRYPSARVDLIQRAIDEYLKELFEQREKELADGPTHNKAKSGMATVT